MTQLTCDIGKEPIDFSVERTLYRCVFCAIFQETQRSVEETKLEERAAFDTASLRSVRFKKATCLKFK